MPWMRIGASSAILTSLLLCHFFYRFQGATVDRVQDSHLRKRLRDVHQLSQPIRSELLLSQTSKALDRDPHQSVQSSQLSAHEDRYQNYDILDDDDDDDGYKSHQDELKTEVRNANNSSLRENKTDSDRDDGASNKKENIDQGESSDSDKTEEADKEEVNARDDHSEEGSSNSSDNDATDTIVNGQADSATKDNTTDSNNSTNPDEEAFSQFVLLQMREDVDDDHPYTLLTIFENSSLVGPFAKNPNISDVKSLDDADKSSWFNDSSYNDRIAFQFRYDLDMKYSIAKPTLSVATGSGIKPKMEFQIHPDSGVGTLTIFYHCVRGNPGPMIIGFNMPVTGQHNVETAWIKECGQGRFEYIAFGFLDHESKFVSFNADGTYGDDEHKKLEVGPIDSSTDLKAVLRQPATNLNFLEPYVMSDSADISVKLRTTVSAGSFGSQIETRFTILYECEGKTTGNVKFTVGIPPWENITATWRKDCGGSESQALLIGTTGEGSFDVMQDGQLKSEYDVADSITTGTIGSHLKVLPPKVHSQKFYLTNSDSTSDIHLQKISITLEPSSVMKVLVGNDAKGGLGGTGGVLERDSAKALTLYFVCEQVGRSAVLVTLPTIRYKNVEFGFVKECNGAPKIYSHSGFMQTAGSLIDAILVLAVVGGVALCIYSIRKRKGANYSPLATSETGA